MAEKRLFQANWSQGQTDGDVVEGTVRRILNMNIGDVGRAETRPALVPFGSTYVGFNQIAYLAYSPSWSSADAWIAMLSDTSLKMVEVNDGIPGFVEFDYPLPINGIDSSKSKMVAYSDRLFIAGVDSNGVPLGVMMLSSTSDEGRFRAPKYLEGTGFEYIPAPVAQRWVLTKIRRDAPKLFSEQVRGFEFLDDNYAGSNGRGVYHWPTAKVNTVDRYEAARAGLVSQMADAGDEAVGLILVMTSMDEDNDNVHFPTSTSGLDPGAPSANERGPDGLYGRKAVIEYKVQYVFYGGQLSDMSEKVVLKELGTDVVIDADNEVYQYSVGVMPVLPIGLDPSVMAINIYRKIIDSGSAATDPDLSYVMIKTVFVDSKGLEDADIDMGDASLSESMLGSNQLWRYGSTAPYADFQLYQPVCGDFWDSGVWNPASMERLVGFDDGTITKTSGWARLGSGHVMYFDTHFGGECTVTYSAEAVPLSAVLNVSFTAMIASRRHGVGAETQAVIRSGADFPVAGYNSGGLPLFRLFSKRDEIANRYTTFSRGAGMPVDFFAVYSVIDEPVLTVDRPALTTYLDAWESSRVPFIGVRDDGRVSLDNEESLNGGLSEDFVNVLPTSIAISGGRLIGVGGKYDGKYTPSRLWYSMFQNFGMVLDGNYLDYGARDDGAAIDVSVYQGRLLIHFMSATYVIDISGGSDMAWRELGANTGIGVLNNHCVAETPIGNVWCDGAGIYIFNGRGITEISHMPDRGMSIRETYLGLIDGNHDRVYASFRKDLKQVWICVAENVLVWDTQTGAWHEHALDEVSSYTGDSYFDIMGMFDINGQNITAIRYEDSHGPYILLANDSDVNSAANFDWGMDVDFDAGAPEIVKKAKRFYTDIMTMASGKQITVSVSGQGSAPIVQDLDVVSVPSMWFPDVNTMVRFSASARGRRIRMSFRNKEGQKWHGAVESLGMSHKLKALK